MTSFLEGCVGSGCARRWLFSVLFLATALGGCNCQKTGPIVGNSGKLVTVPSLDFGNVPVGHKVQKQLPLRNNGGGELNLLSQSIGSDPNNAFSEPVPFASAVDIGGSETAELQFLPEDAGAMSAILTLKSDGNPANATVMLTGTGLAINVVADPASVDFGSVQVDSCPTQTEQIAFTNEGSQPAQLTLAPPPGDGGFTLSDSNGTVSPNEMETIPPGGTYDVTVNFDPPDAGNYTSDLSFTACASPTVCLPSQSIPLNGVGVQGQLCLSPNPISFMGVTTSAQTTITVQNCGANSVDLQCLYLQSTGNSTCDTGDTVFGLTSDAGVAPTPGSPVTLAPNQSFTFTMVYTPSGSDAGDGDVLLADFLPQQACSNATASDQILGNQPLNPCSLTITPSTLDFGMVTTGTPVTRSAVLSNSGQVDCDVSMVALSLTSDPSYSIPVSQPLSFTVPAGGTAPINVDFSLNNSSTPNTRTGTVTFASSDPADPMGSIPLVATLNAMNPYATGWPKWHLDNNNSGQSTADTSSNTGLVVWKYPGLTSAASLLTMGNPEGWTTGDNGCGFTYLQGPVVADDPAGSGAYAIYQMDLSGTIYAFSADGGVLWKTMTSDPSTDPHPSTPAVIKGGAIWAISGSDAYSKSGKKEAHLNALFLLAPDGGILVQEPYGKDGFDACPGLANDGTLFEADDNSRVDAGSQLPPPLYSDEFSAMAFQSNVSGGTAAATLVAGAHMALTQVSERFGIAIGNDGTSFWGNNGQFFSLAPLPGFGLNPAWPAGGVTIANNTKDTNAVGTVFSDLALDPINTNFVFAYSAWEDGVSKNGGYYAFGTVTGPYTVSGVISALSLSTGALQWTQNLPTAALPTGWVQNCADYGNAAPAVGVNGAVYVGNGDGLRAFTGADGGLQWFFPSANVTTSPAIGGDGTVFFGCADGTFYALNQDGTLRYKLPVGAPVSASPAIADDGTVFFTSDDGTVWAVR